jgi:hypothetical protein
MTRGTMAAKLLADDICGEESELLDLMRSVPKAGRLPPEPILNVAVNGRLWSNRWTGTREI